MTGKGPCAQISRSVINGQFTGVGGGVQDSRGEGKEQQLLGPGDTGSLSQGKQREHQATLQGGATLFSRCPILSAGQS